MAWEGTRAEFSCVESSIEIVLIAEKEVERKEFPDPNSMRLMRLEMVTANREFWLCHIVTASDSIHQAALFRI